MYPVTTKGTTRTPCSNSGLIRLHIRVTAPANTKGSPISHKKPMLWRPYRVLSSRISKAQITLRCVASSSRTARKAPKLSSMCRS
jgi:hypothetical protein